MWWGIGAGILVCMAIAIGVAMRRKNGDEVARAIQLFRQRREVLEAKFFELAAATGKPRGLRWVKCDWHPEVDFARDVQTGLLTAFVAVDIHFAAIEGGEMEDVEAVGHFREASAVFHYQDGAWGTGGKTLNNMRPREAVDWLVGQYERVGTPEGLGARG